MFATVHESFLKVSEKFADRIALRYQRRDRWFEMSFGELRSKVDGVFAWLSRAGIGKADPVIIIADNSPEWVAVFFAVLMRGAVAVPLSVKITEKELEYILKDSMSMLAFVDGSTPLASSGVWKSSSCLKRVVVIDKSNGTAGGLLGNIVKKHKAPPHRDTSSGVLPDDLACLVYTSGTTGEPKGVMLTHRNLASNHRSLTKLNLIQGSDRLLALLPLHHTYSLQVTLLVPLLIGCTVIYPGSLKSEAVIDALRTWGATVFVGVPELFYVFHRKIREGMSKIPLIARIPVFFCIETLWFIRKWTGLNGARYCLSFLRGSFGGALRFIVSGGAKLNEKVETDFFKWGFTILEGYGLTETSPVLTINPLGSPKIGSVGLPVPGVKIRIDRPDERGSGEVIAQGDNITVGYFKRMDLTKESIKERWFYTGDRGYIDKDGYLFLTGRTKETIVLSSGVNINPEEIEIHYGKIRFIKEICVFEARLSSDPDMPETLFAVIVPHIDEFKKRDESNLRDVIRGRLETLSQALPSHKRITGFVITHQTLPRTELGKLKRFAIKELYAPQIEHHTVFRRERPPLSSADEAILGSDIAQRVLSYVRDQCRLDGDIFLDDGLEIDLGLDSLGKVELTSGLERELGIVIPDDLIMKVFTVRDLLRELESIRSDTAPKEALSPGSSPDIWKKMLNQPPGSEMVQRIELKPPWYDIFLTRLSTACLFLILRAGYRLRIVGVENLPGEGPYILSVNHTSYFDGFIVASSLPADIRTDLFFIGYRGYFNFPVVRGLIKRWRIIPIDLASHMLEAMRAASFILRHKKIICIFPEGERSVDGTIREFKKGIGILAAELDVPIVPVIITGAFEVWPRGKAMPYIPNPFPRKDRFQITVRFGSPAPARELSDVGMRHGPEDGYRAIADGLRSEMIAMNKKALSGQDPKGAEAANKLKGAS